MKKNFLLADAVAIQFEDEYYDLYNWFVISTIEINFIGEFFTIRFSSQVEGPPNEMRIELSICFHKVDFLDMSPGVFQRRVSDISEVGYKAANDFDSGWLVSETKKGYEDHLFFRLAGDEFIRVHGECATLSIQNYVR